MLEEIILHIQSLAVINVRGRLHDLIIWTSTSGPVLVLKLLFQLLRKTRKSLGGAVEQFTVNMKKANHLSTLKKAIAVFTPVMRKLHQEHRAYKFQIAVSVVFHKAVDLAVIYYTTASGTGIGNGCRICRCCSTSR